MKSINIELSIRETLLVSSIVALCCLFTACAAVKEEEGDVPCDIGVVFSEGNRHTAEFTLDDDAWTELTKAQKENIVAQCVDLVEFFIDNPPEEEEADEELFPGSFKTARAEAGKTDYEIAGFDTLEGKTVFIYRSKDQQTVFLK